MLLFSFGRKLYKVRLIRWASCTLALGIVLLFMHTQRLIHDKVQAIDSLNLILNRIVLDAIRQDNLSQIVPASVSLLRDAGLTSLTLWDKRGEIIGSYGTFPDELPMSHDQLQSAFWRNLGTVQISMPLNTDQPDLGRLRAVYRLDALRQIRNQFFYECVLLVTWVFLSCFGLYMARFFRKSLNLFFKSTPLINSLSNVPADVHPNPSVDSNSPSASTYSELFLGFSNQHAELPGASQGGAHEQHLNPSSLSPDAQEILKQLEQMKSAFLSNITQEIRMPMNAILSFSRLGSEHPEQLDVAKINHYFNTIHTNSIQLSRILDDLLDLSKLQEKRMRFEFEEVLVSALVRMAINDLERIASHKQLTLRLEDHASYRRAYADPLRIGQVIRSLLHNAVKFSPADSEIRIVVEETPEQGVRCSIFNSGPLIPSQDLNLIFEKFSDISHRLPGRAAGLGLPIAREIMLAHGGHIWAENISTGGVVFRFTLPPGKAL